MAKRFRFPLDGVRKVRRQARDVRRRAVAEAARAVHDAESRIADLSKALQHTIELTRGAQGRARLDAAMLGRHQVHRSHLAIGDASFADAGVRGNPLVAGVDDLLQVVVGHASRGDIAAPAGDTGVALRHNEASDTGNESKKTKICRPNKGPGFSDRA